MFRAENTAFVYVFDANERCVCERVVATGAVRNDAIEIVSGIDAGELVVVAGQQRVRDESAVRLAADCATAGVLQILSAHH